MRADSSLVDRFFRCLIEEIREQHPEYLEQSFTVAEIYQALVPYRTHRDRIGVEMNGDYEDALLRLLAGEGAYLELESDTARERIRLELRSPNPNTGMYREFAAVGVRVRQDRLGDVGAPDGGAKKGGATKEASAGGGSGAKEDGAAAEDVRASPPADGSRSLSEPSAPRRDRGGTPSAPEPTASRAGRRAGRDSRVSVSLTAGDVAAEGKPRKVEPSESPAGHAEPPPGGAEAPESCPDCSTDLPRRDSLRFCPHCGANVFVVPCGSCGEVLEREWRFCIACGTAAS